MQFAVHRRGGKGRRLDLAVVCELEVEWELDGRDGRDGKQARNTV